MGRVHHNRISNGFSLTDFMMFRSRWWQHLLFWGIVYFILINVFKTSSALEKIDLIYTIIFVVPLVAIVYLNLYHFIPRYLRREQYLFYSLFFLLWVGGGAAFLYVLFDRWIDYLLPNYFFISYHSIPQLMLYTGSLLLLTTLLKLSRSWFMLLRVERMTTSQQLKSLQSQINPHFLLNSLQSIYALSLEKSDQTPEVILQLSEILKYTLYETEHSRVQLKKEISMIRDYVEMYRHRVDPVRADIRLHVNGDPDELVIAPMLLIPFIENSFKHGLQGEAGNAFVHIRMEILEQQLHFQIENNLGEPSDVKLKNGGIGIDNTRQRLELLYPGKYNLKISREPGSFMVRLQLELTS